MYTSEQRTKVDQFFYENDKSIVKTQRAFKQYFNLIRAPSGITIRDTVKRFQETGSTLNRKKRIVHKQL